MEEKMDNTILSVKNLVVEYTSEKDVVQAVNDVSFELEYGGTIGLVGETGAGKTTIAKAICRILPVPPSRVKNGEIYFEGQDILQIPEEKMRKLRGAKISMIFQDPMTALNPIMRVGNQIAESIRNNIGCSKQEAEEKAKEMLEMVGIPASRYREYPHQFSGGMKQRVVIAIALACNPDLLIADEPTTALDVTIQAQVLELIKKLQKEKNTAMIMITHDFGIVAQVCDAVAVVYAGQIVEYGSKQQIFKDARHPYTLGLFHAIPKLDEDADKLLPISGAPTDPTNLPKGCYFSPRCPYATDVCRKGPIPMRTMVDGHKFRCIHENVRVENAEQA